MLLTAYCAGALVGFGICAAATCYLLWLQHEQYGELLDGLTSSVQTDDQDDFRLI